MFSPPERSTKLSAITALLHMVLEELARAIRQEKEMKGISKTLYTLKKRKEKLVSKENAKEYIIKALDLISELNKVTRYVSNILKVYPVSYSSSEQSKM